MSKSSKYILFLVLSVVLLAACAQRDKKDDHQAAPAADTLELADIDNIDNKETSNAGYFLPNELILEKMELAVTKMQSKKQTDPNENDEMIKLYREIFDQDMRDLLEISDSKVNRFDFAQFENRFGKPDNIGLRSDSTGSYVEAAEEWVYPHFMIKSWYMHFYNESDRDKTIIGIDSDSKGFGFSGIYVAVPECNKDYIDRLFAHIHPDNIIREKFDGEDYYYISLNSQELGMYGITIYFDEKDLVKEVQHYVQPFN